jgi:ribosomal-protein-serine acetyltransferase
MALPRCAWSHCPYGVSLIIETLSVAPGISAVPVRLADAGALAGLVADNIAHLRTFLPKVTGLDNRAAAEEHLQCVLDAQGDLLEWHIFSDERLCGAIRLNHIEQDHRKASIGYYLGARHQGSGLATASVRAVLQFAFERLGMNRIELRCASGNAASQRVAERLGFSWEGLLRQAELVDGVYLDCFVYGLLRDDFLARATGGLGY